MKKILLSLLCLLPAAAIWAQGEETLWTFGTRGGLDFTATTPVPYTNNLFPGDEGSATICSGTGQLLFYTNGFWIWNRDHQIMPELTGGVSGYTAPIATSVGYPPLMTWNGGYATQATAIAGFPGHPDQYFVFSLSTTGLLHYTLVDMSLNSGKGGIVAGKKGIIIATGLSEKMTVVKGCTNVWLMTRVRAANQYKAFEINDTGIVTTPVVSNVGNLPVAWYRCGVIKFSKDGTKMAAACNAGTNVNNGGLELYDFDYLTGILSNAALLDSSNTLGYYYGACFSPDGSRLYASTSSLGYGSTLYYGKVHQFDVSLPTVAAIAASNTVVFTDYSGSDLDRLGDLKRGLNDKIYFSSGKGSAFLHRINFPNALGMACSALPNSIALSTGYAQRGLPNDIALISPPDTVHTTKIVTVCFKDSTVLVADSGRKYQWESGENSRQKIVTTNGRYIVRFINMNCQYEIDSYKVSFSRLPVTGANAYSCPGSKQGKLWISPQAGDTTGFAYEWRNSNGQVLQQHQGKRGDTLVNADTGVYSIRITTPFGCDTVLEMSVLSLPVPDASFVVDSIACKGVQLQFSNNSTAPLWKWYFGDGNFSTQNSPAYAYPNTGNYTASLIVTNIEGCSDTATKLIVVKGLDLTLTASKELVNRGEQVDLFSAGSEPYTVLEWQPANLFPNQSNVNQSVTLDTTKTFIVKGISFYGCTAEAAVTVAVNPIVFMPTGFTPNGDGLNDRFRPVASGYIFVRYFEIYNRYGQQVFSAFGAKGLEGWDGTFHGQLEDIGTYYYHINIETKQGGTILLKGDVTLIR